MKQSDWQIVTDLIRDKLNLDCQLKDICAVHGGDINQAWRLDSGDTKYFVKTNQHENLAMFEAEQFGLRSLKQSQSIRVPEVIGCGQTENEAFIVIEFINLGGTINDAQFGHQLAAMHQHGHQAFGFEIDNTIGTTPQINTFNEDWVLFWQQNRLGYQLRLAHSNGLDREMIKLGDRLNERMNRFFTDYRPVPSLLHGDLWSGNRAADERGNSVIFDPASYYGDHEADLAMMELFGQPSGEFFDAYRDVFKIDSGYSIRRDLYNLYHILNHANLFGGGYGASAKTMIERLLGQI